MSETVIRAEGLSKRYRIGVSSGPYRTLRETLMEAPLRPVRAARARLGRGRAGEARADELWALRDVSFGLSAGEVLGIIGRNGAGKSTLLKVLSRITEPTSGRAEVRGRVGSLLEVGTGFHPELTGRENIYLNGAILGMRRAEIKARFDEIAAFAELERFLDTPVKRYSSGMYMRLAFSVAAHLETEILIVDEVLAVGDLDFQRRCLGKMGDVARSGRTVIFVSHNLAAVERLCTRAILLDAGVVTCDGRADDVVRQYALSSDKSGSAVDLEAPAELPPGRDVVFTSVEIKSADGQPAPTIEAGDGFVVTAGYRTSRPLRDLVFSIALFNSRNVPVFGSYSSDANLQLPRLAGDATIEIKVDPVNLLPGQYSLHVAVGDSVNPHRYERLPDVLQLDVEQSGAHGTIALGASEWATIFVPCEWSVVAETAAV
jgi:lipopolysaccharide transport system ATP-binding protein